MFQVFGFLDHRTWSVGRKTFANSVMKTSRSIARQTHELAGHHETALGIVRSTLLMIHVRMRWLIACPCSTNATMFVHSVRSGGHSGRPWPNRSRC